VSGDWIHVRGGDLENWQCTTLNVKALDATPSLCLNGLGAQRIPDPTTSGDFTRRFSVEDITTLQECINRTRQRVWQQQPKGFLEEAFIDVDGTIAQTYGECKGGMSLSYKGIWGYAPLTVSLANTREVLYLVNRPGNAASHQDSVPWIDRAIDQVRPVAGRITLRGDTDFTHTAQLDRWDQSGIFFIMGMDAHPKVVGSAEALSERSWTPLERLAKYEILTEPPANCQKATKTPLCDAWNDIWTKTPPIQ